MINIQTMEYIMFDLLNKEPINTITSLVITIIIYSIAVIGIIYIYYTNKRLLIQENIVDLDIYHNLKETMDGG